MANKKRTPEQNKAIYQRRVQRARTEGYRGYGQKRYAHTKAKRLGKLQEILEEEMRNKFPGYVKASEVIDLTPDRQRAYDRLKASGLFTERELADLFAAGNTNNFWQLARPMLEATSP